MKKASFHVGDNVTIPMAGQRVPALVVEDRGPIGLRGRRIYRVEVPMDPFEPRYLERPETEIEIASGNGKAAPSAAAVMDYFNNGGLLAMLWANVANEKASKVWLTVDTLGNLTYTFANERGLLGGELIPFFAVREDRIFTPKRDEVAKFLRSFGLSKPQVEEVLAAVGTAP